MAHLEYFAYAERMRRLHWRVVRLAWRHAKAQRRCRELEVRLREAERQNRQLRIALHRDARGIEVTV